MTNNKKRDAAVLAVRVAGVGFLFLAGAIYMYENLEEKSSKSYIVGCLTASAACITYGTVVLRKYLKEFRNNQVTTSSELQLENIAPSEKEIEPT